MQNAFSLTEQWIFDPTLRMCAPLRNDPLHPTSFKDKIWHRIKAEGMTRIVALFTFFFGAADTFMHLSIGLYKIGYLQLRKFCYLKPASWNKTEAIDHLRVATFFAGVTLVGSIAGMIWPHLFKDLKGSPTNPANQRDSFYENSLVPEQIEMLANAVQSGAEKQPFNKLKEFLLSGNPSSKHWFLKVFNHDSNNFRAVRETLVNLIYRPVKHDLYQKQVKWLNDLEISEAFSLQAERFLSKGFYFHATSKKAIESILKKRKVTVQYEQAYHGAFVLTRPEIKLGSYILVFNREIERLSPIEHGFTLINKIIGLAFPETSL